MSLALSFETLVEALYFEAKIAATPQRITFIGDDGSEEVISYLTALEEAYGRAGALQRRGVERGEPVVVILPTSSEFLFVFFGLLLAGAIPAPLSPPASFGDEDFLLRAERVVRYLGARRVITTEGLREMLEQALPGVDVVLAERLRDEAAARAAPYAPVAVHASDVAMIQCTSGSTGQSKGVMLTHENLISNVYQIGWSLDVKSTDVGVSWLPLYHDMGLIGCFLFCIYWNIGAVLLSPFRFLRRPASWLAAIARHRGSLTTAPNFAYSYLTARVRDEELAGLDLSSWRVAGCGAEPINPRTLLRFEERFARFGLRPNILTPCYGLAEATLAVTFHPVGHALEYDHVARRALAERGEARDAAVDDADTLEVVNCGLPMPETRVRIVGADGRPLEEDRIGRVQVAGPAVMKGYFRLPAETGEALREGWLETGDLGYLRKGGLRITGRSKDLVIIRGKNYFPSDFEWAAEEVAGIRKGCVVAFGLADAAGATEALYLICETDSTEAVERDAIAAAVRARVAARTGVAPAHVELVARNFVPKTSSGKLQRRRTKELFLAAREESRA